MLYAQWLKDDTGKLYSKWINTETNHSDLSDDELRSRVNVYFAELLRLEEVIRLNREEV